MRKSLHTARRTLPIYIIKKILDINYFCQRIKYFLGLIEHEKQITNYLTI